MAFISNVQIGETTNGLRAVAIPSGTVDSTSTETAFTATVPGITELKHGVCCFIKNGVVTSAANCTLNINGLGAKPIYSSMAAASAISTVFNINYTMLFVYDETRVTGGCWVLYYGYNAGYTSNVAQGQCYGTCSTAAGTKAKTVSMSSYALVAQGICAIKFTNGNTAASATLNINSKGAKAIYWNGAACPTDLIKANDVVIMVYSTQYHIVGIYNGNRGFATTTPVMDGTGAIGTSTEYARADHVHPTDTSRAASTHAHGNITNAGNVTTTTTIAANDAILLSKNTTGTVVVGPTFDASTTNKFLSQKGTWETASVSLPTATSTTPGIVTLGATGGAAEYDHTHSGYAASDHAHGQITNAGAVTTTVTVASSDRILISDNSDSSKVKGGPVFDTGSTTYYLTKAGTWAIPVGSTGDHKVTQAAAITTSGNYPILLGNTTATTTVTATVNKASTLVYNPNTKKLLVNSATVALITDVPTWSVS